MAIARIEDQKTLAKLLKQDTNKYVRLEGIQSLDDQQLLIDVFLNEKTEVCKSAITQKLDHDSLLTLRLLASQEDQTLIINALRKFKQV